MTITDEQLRQISKARDAIAAAREAVHDISFEPPVHEFRLDNAAELLHDAAGWVVEVLDAEAATARGETGVDEKLHGRRASRKRGFIVRVNVRDDGAGEHGIMMGLAIAADVAGHVASGLENLGEPGGVARALAKAFIEEITKRAKTAKAARALRETAELEAK